MTITVSGLIVDSIGHYLDRAGVGAVPAADFDIDQDPAILLDWAHQPDSVIGEVRHLEHDESGLWAISTSEHDELADAETPLYYSAAIDQRAGRLLLGGLALTTAPALIGARPVSLHPGGLGEAAGTAQPWETRQRIARARDTSRSRRPGAPIRIAGPDRVEQRRAEVHERPFGVEVEHAAAYPGGVLEVR